ncbi:unnamed protein product [Schistosoma spindalis]|nr:unnamed protein product [Schistosoma spindale]
MKMAGTVCCGFAKRPAYKHWVSSGSLQLIEARLSTPGDREFDHRRRMLRNEIGQSLRKAQKPGGRSVLMSWKQQLHLVITGSSSNSSEPLAARSLV